MANLNEVRYCYAHGIPLDPGFVCMDCIANKPPVLSVRVLQGINVQRAIRWHHGGLDNWSPLEWAGAMCGEAGEAANVAKKLRRIEGELFNVDERSRNFPVSEDQAAKYRHDLAKECADTILYCVLTIARVGHDAEDVLREVFNHKSEEYGFPERI